MIVANQPASGKQITWAVALFISLWTAHVVQGQNLDFKIELFNRGVEQLKLQEKTSYRDIDNAMEAAFAIDPDRLVKKLVSQYSISESEAFRASVNASEFALDSRPILRYLPQKDFTLRNAYQIGNLSYQMGTRREDFSLLLNSCESFLTTSDFEKDLLPAKGRAAKEKFSPAAIKKRRTEYLLFHYNLGKLQNKETLESVEFFQRGISNSKLKEYIHAVWLTRVGIKVLTGAELLKEIKKIKPKEFAVRVLVESLQRYDQGRLKSMVGDVLVAQLIRQSFDPQSDRDETDFYLIDLEECFPQFDLVQGLFRSTPPRKIIEIAKGSQLFQSELQIMEQVKMVNAKSKIEPQLLNAWSQALVNSCLAAGNSEDAQKIAEHFFDQDRAQVRF